MKMRPPRWSAALRRIGLPVDLVALVIALCGLYLSDVLGAARGARTLLGVYLLTHLLHSAARRIAGAQAGRRLADVMHIARILIVLALILLYVVSPLWRTMYARQAAGPHTSAHDGVIQVEEAMKLLLDGRNPYAVTYEGTPLRQWTYAGPGTNPALYNLAYLPFTVLIGIPLYLLSVVTFGWYDQRFVYLLALGVALWTFWKLARNRTMGLVALIVIGLHPLSARFLSDGRNDILVVALLGLSLYSLRTPDRRWSYAASGVCFGLACAAKQTAWLFAPFYLLYVWGLLARTDGRTAKGRARELGRRLLLPALGTVAVVVLPFLLWNPARFFEGTVLYVSGNVAHNYPIPATDAYGLHILLSSPVFWGALDALTSGPLEPLRPLAESVKIRSPFGYYPFWTLQAVFALPVFLLALRRQLERNTIAVALAGYSVTLFVFAYFSRFLHDNYIWYLTMLFALACTVREPRRVALPAAEQSVAGMSLAPMPLPLDALVVALPVSAYIRETDALSWEVKAVVTFLILLYLLAHVLFSRVGDAPEEGRATGIDRALLAKVAILVPLVLLLSPLTA